MKVCIDTAEKKRPNMKNTILDTIMNNSFSIDNISPHVRFISEYKAAPGFFMRPRILYDHLMEYICKGKGFYTINKITYTVSAGDIIIIAPDTVHSIVADNDSPFIRQCVHFDFFYMGGYELMPLWEVKRDKMQKDKLHSTPGILEDLKIPIVSHMKNIPEIRSLFTRLFREMYFKDDGYKLAVKTCMMNIILNLHKNALLNDSKSTDEPAFTLPNAIANARKYIENNSHERLTLPIIAEVAHYHPVHFERLFKRYIGCPPIEYLLFVRIRKSKEFLEHSELSITQIANEAGFDSIQYFDRVFKKITGFSPSRYKHLVRNGKDFEAELTPYFFTDYPTETTITEDKVND